MIGIGKWTGPIDTMFYKGNVTFYIKDAGGKYDFDFDLPAGINKVPDYEFTEIAEDGNTLNIKAKVSLLPGKSVDAALTFDGDTMHGVVKVPFIGKIKVQNFRRVG
ncbi:MAG: hypothetical protein IJ766_02475 [Clostridia bacterium]|nr:hypothetical protein [Clostridia bacterium]